MATSRHYKNVAIEIHTFNEHKKPKIWFQNPFFFDLVEHFGSNCLLHDYK